MLRGLAALIADEQNPEKLAELVVELDRLLAEKQARLDGLKYVAVSPITLRCERCGTEPGEACEIIPGESLEIVHVERIEAALAMDAVAMDRIRLNRRPPKPSA